MVTIPNRQTISHEDRVAQFKQFNEQNFVRLVRETYRQVTNNLNKRLEICGITDLSARHLSIFDHLDAEGTNIVTLAQRAGISKQAMSKLVKEATESGYVFVRTDTKDSRLVIVSFTEKGMKFLNTLTTELLKAREVILKTAQVSHEDVNATTDTLSRLLAYFDVAQNKALMN